MKGVPSHALAFRDRNLRRFDVRKTPERTRDNAQFESGLHASVAVFESQVDDACERGQRTHAQCQPSSHDAHFAMRGACCQMRLLSIFGLEPLLSLTSLRGVP